MSRSVVRGNDLLRRRQRFSPHGARFLTRRSCFAMRPRTRRTRASDRPRPAGARATSEDAVPAVVGQRSPQPLTSARSCRPAPPRSTRHRRFHASLPPQGTTPRHGVRATPWLRICKKSAWGAVPGCPAAAGRTGLVGVHAGHDLRCRSSRRRARRCNFSKRAVIFLLARVEPRPPHARERSACAADVLAQQLVGSSRIVLVGSVRGRRRATGSLS